MNEDGDSLVPNEFTGYLESSLRFLFSWMALMPIAVIVSGKITSATLKLPRQSRQLFRITIPKVFNLEARGDEVVFGFATFFVNFLVIAALAGKPAYQMFTDRFGLDPGQFNALCILSSFTSVTASILLVSATRIFGRLRSRTDASAREYEMAVERIAEEHSEEGSRKGESLG